MKVLVQRVSQASCVVGGKTHSAIGAGLALFVSFQKGDDASLLPWMAKKVANLRIFEDSEGKMNVSVTDTGGEILSISQFTLEAKTQKGNRPSFTGAMPPTEANALYEQFNEMLRRQYAVSVATGAFQEHMDISLINDGPVTILLERTHHS